MPPDPIVHIAQTLGTHAAASFVGLLLAVEAAAVVGWHGLRRVVPPHGEGGLPPPGSMLPLFVLAFALAFVTAASFAAGASALQAQAPLARFDVELAGTLARQPPLALLVFCSVVTHLGDARLLTGLVVAVAAALAWRGRMRLALGWLLVCAGNGLLVRALKQLFERTRPLHDHGYAQAAGFSFPSGHTAGAVVVYGMLAYVLLRLLDRRWHRPLVVATAGLVFTIGCSRAVLQVHWASDVLAGFALGTCWLAVCLGGIGLWRRRARPAG